MRQPFQRDRRDHRQPQGPSAWRVFGGLVAALTLLGFPVGSAEIGPTVGISGKGLQIDGRQVFLLGVSLFDALGATPPRDQDLDALENWGVGLVRVWAHWHEPIYQADGALTAQGRSRLLQLVQRLQARGMLLEFVLLRPGQLSGQPYAVFSSAKARLRAVQEIAIALRDHRNVLFDLYNEHDHPDGPISHADARLIRDVVKAVDPLRLVTISSTATHLITPDGHLGAQEAANLREEVGQDAGSVGVDLVAPHLPRTADWASSTGARIAALGAVLDRIGRSMPIYLSEERRSERPGEIEAEAYRRAYLGARDAGAAGWVLHTPAGFELGKRPFVDALAPEERAALAGLKR